MANPPPCSAGTVSRLDEVNCVMVLGESPAGAAADDAASVAASAGEPAGGCEGSGVFATILPCAVASALAVTGGAAAEAGAVATQRVPSGGVGAGAAARGAPSRPAGLPPFPLAPFF